MALYHVHAAYIRKGRTTGGATGLRKYLCREEAERSSQVRRYIERDGSGKDDLVMSGSAYLPSWAKDVEHFWWCADTYERQKGVIAWTYQVTLPRELSEEARQTLADDIRDVCWRNYPQTWAIHNPQAQDGSGEQPHVHVMVCPRKPTDSYERTATQWFRRAATKDQGAWEGGVPKDTYMRLKPYLYGIREAVAVLTNAALEREGLPLAVSHQTLAQQGHERTPSVYRLYGSNPAQEKAAALTERRQLQTEAHPSEHRANLQAWEKQKATFGITDISRTAVNRHVEHWLQDRREYGWQQKLARDIKRLEYELNHVETRQRMQQRARQHLMTTQRTVSEPLVRHGLRARFLDEEQDYGRAVGRGY